MWSDVASEAVRKCARSYLKGTSIAGSDTGRWRLRPRRRRRRRRALGADVPGVLGAGVLIFGVGLGLDPGRDAAEAVDLLLTLTQRLMVRVELLLLLLRPAVLLLLTDRHPLCLGDVLSLAHCLELLGTLISPPTL